MKISRQDYEKFYYSYFYSNFLIISTSLTKNSTRELEDKIFNSKEQIKILSDKRELILLEHNYLSSPERLFELKENLIDENLKPLKVKIYITPEK